MGNKPSNSDKKDLVKRLLTPKPAGKQMKELETMSVTEVRLLENFSRLTEPQRAVLSKRTITLVNAAMRKKRPVDG